MRAQITQDNSGNLKLEIEITQGTHLISSISVPEATRLLNEIKSVLRNKGERFITMSGINSKEDLELNFPNEYQKIETLFSSKEE